MQVYEMQRGRGKGIERKEGESEMDDGARKHPRQRLRAVVHSVPISVRPLAE